MVGGNKTIQISSAGSSIIRSSTATNNLDFGVTFPKHEVNTLIKKIRDEAARLHREHIKSSLKDAAITTESIVSKRSVKERTQKTHVGTTIAGGAGGAATMIGQSLGYHMKFATTNKNEWVAGSYDFDERTGNFINSRTGKRGMMPTGVRAKDMKKRDISLTQIYEAHQGPFEQTGIITDTATLPAQNIENWKRQEIAQGRPIFYAMKGYGMGQSRKGKPAPKWRRSGWRGLNTIAFFERQVRDNLANAQSLQKKLDNLTIDTPPSSQQTSLLDF